MALTLLFIFLCLFFERERESKPGRGRYKGRERSQAGSMLSGEGLTQAGLEPMNREILTLAKSKSQMLNQLSHPGTPKIVCCCFCFFERERERGSK